jgi:hypothetical protein
MASQEASPSFPGVLTADEDCLVSFIRDRCVLGDGERVATFELLAAFKKYVGNDARTSGWRCKDMAKVVRGKGFQEKRLKQNGGGPYHTFLGLRLRAPAE